MANPQEKFRSALLGIANEMDKLYSLEVEMVEALKAGDVCISRMNTALSHFGSAKNWGQWDMVGGGLGMIKHGSIDQGMREAFQAKNDLMRSLLKNEKILNTLHFWFYTSICKV